MAEHRSRILGIGTFIPPRVVTNAELATKMETSNEWIIERTGIEERHWVDPGESGAGMGAKAARQALERAKVDAKDVDMLIYATLSPDCFFPGTGVFVQREHVLLSTHIHADGSEAEILWTQYPASSQHPRISEQAMAERRHYPTMVGKKVFKHAVTRMPAAIMEGMIANNLKLDDIKMVIPH